MNQWILEIHIEHHHWETHTITDHHGKKHDEFLENQTIFLDFHHCAQRRVCIWTPIVGSYLSHGICAVFPVVDFPHPQGEKVAKFL